MNTFEEYRDEEDPGLGDDDPVVGEDATPRTISQKESATRVSKANLMEPLTATSRKILEEMLKPTESLLYVERPMFWQATGISLVVTFIATIIAVIAIIVFKQHLTGSMFAVAGSFPLGFLLSLYGYFRSKDSFTAFTDKRLLVKPMFGKRFAVAYKHIVEAVVQTNYLQCRKEMAVKRYRKSEGRPKVVYLEALPRMIFYQNLLEEKMSGSLPPVDPS